MGKTEKVMAQVLSGRADANIGFDDLIHLQRDGNKTKPYQVKQVRAVILKYRVGD